MRPMSLAVATSVVLLSGWFAWAQSPELEKKQPVPSASTLEGVVVDLNRFLTDSIENRRTENPRDEARKKEHATELLGFLTRDRLFVILRDPADPKSTVVRKLLGEEKRVKVKARVFEKKGLFGIRIAQVIPETGS